MSFNNKGISGIALLIAAAVGLIVIAGISKAIINFSGQSMRTMRSNQVARFKQNVVQRLGDIDSWKKSKELAGGKIPGENTNITLYHKDGSGPWVCKRKGGGRAQGIAVLDRNGTPQRLNCGQCSSNEYCGFPPKDFSIVHMDATTKGDLIPSYSLELHDTAGNKTLEKFESLSANEKLYDEEQMTCQPDEFLRMVVNGKPVCEKHNVLLWNKTCPNDWQYLYGFDNNGQPRCDDIRPYIASEINRFNTTFADPNVTRVDRRITQEGSIVTNKIKKVGITRKYVKVYGRNDKECAHKNTMTCPKGYMMFAYESRQPTMGNNCSIQCRKLIDR